MLKTKLQIKIYFSAYINNVYYWTEKVISVNLFNPLMVIMTQINLIRLIRADASAQHSIAKYAAGIIIDY